MALILKGCILLVYQQSRPFPFSSIKGQCSHWSIQALTMKQKCNQKAYYLCPKVSPLRHQGISQGLHLNSRTLARGSYMDPCRLHTCTWCRVVPASLGSVPGWPSASSFFDSRSNLWSGLRASLNIVRWRCAREDGQHFRNLASCPASRASLFSWRVARKARCCREAGSGSGSTGLSSKGRSSLGSQSKAGRRTGCSGWAQCESP